MLFEHVFPRSAARFSGPWHNAWLLCFLQTPLQALCRCSVCVEPREMTARPSQRASRMQGASGALSRGPGDALLSQTLVE